MVPLCVHGLYTVKPVLMDTSVNRRPPYLSPLIFHYMGHLSNVYNGQMICAQEALIRLNEPVYYGRLIRLGLHPRKPCLFNVILAAACMLHKCNHVTSHRKLRKKHSARN